MLSDDLCARLEKCFHNGSNFSTYRAGAGLVCIAADPIGGVHEILQEFAVAVLTYCPLLDRHLTGMVKTGVVCLPRVASESRVRKSI